MGSELRNLRALMIGAADGIGRAVTGGFAQVVAGVVRHGAGTRA